MVNVSDERTRHDEGLARLMEGYLDGDPRSFRALYGRLEGRVRGLLWTLVRDSAAVNDVLHETFMEAHRSRASFRWRTVERDRCVASWYMAIARNAALDHLGAGSPSDRTLESSAPESRTGTEAVFAEGPRPPTLGEC